MKTRAYILLLIINSLVVISYAQKIDSTNIDSLLQTKFDAYYPKTFTLEDSVFEEGSVLVVEVLFHYNYSGIHEKSFPLLDSISNFLKKNKEINLVVNYYTDFRGSEKYNKALSDNRAHSIKYFFISKGISENRLSSIGKGESELIISKEETFNLPSKMLQEKAHALNRRPEFKIISLE